MKIDKNTMFSITEANQNIPKIGRMLDESMIAKDEDVMEISKQLIAQNMEAYEELAK